MKSHPEQTALDSSPSLNPTAPPRSAAERWKIIADTLEQLRPRLQADGGDIALVAVDGLRVRVRLGGACVSCGDANHTLGGIRRKLVSALGEPVLVVPAS